MASPVAIRAQHLRQEEAIRAFERGWLLTPLRGKRPYLKKWQQKAPPTLEEVKGWASAENVGLRTGLASDVVVIDDDTEDHLAASILELPESPTVVTGSGKLHYYFRAPAVLLRNSAGRLAPHVDVRANGGAAALAGSIHPDTGRSYEWAPGLSPDDVPLAPFPQALLEQLNGQRGRDASMQERLRRYVAATLENCVREVAEAPEGTRNEELNRQAFKLGRFVGASLLDEIEVIDRLARAGREAGLEEHEVLPTLRSGLTSGREQPIDPSKLLRSGKQGPRAPSPPPPGKDDPLSQPQIVVAGGDLPEIIQEAEDALLGFEHRDIYQRGSLLVRVLETPDTSSSCGIKRQQGVLTSLPVEVPYLALRFTNAARWYKTDRRSKHLRPIDCPDRVAKTYIAMAGHWRVPALAALIQAPTVRPDGSLLDKPGYDSTTRIYYQPGGIEFAPVHPKPTKDEAHRGLIALRDLVREFPFEKPEDRAVALAAFVTAIVRPCLRTAPLHAFTAPTMASGKSLLVDCASLIATGRPAPAMSQGHSEEEDRKRITAMFLDGSAISLIDNIERPLGSDALCSALTQEIWRDRVLGASRMVSLPTCTTWFATGNNLTIVGDLVTRAVVCRLDPNCEHPEERRFEVDLRRYIPANRSQIVPAALTIIRAYIEAGRPDQALQPFGRFEDWSDIVRSSLVWLGEADPCETRRRVEREDPVRQRLAALFTVWEECFGTRAISSRELIRQSHQAKEQDRLLPLLEEITNSSRGDINSRRLGHFLAAHEGRMQNGQKLVRAGDRRGSALWRLNRA